MDEEAEYRRMQVKVLYSFNDNPTVFLSRSSGSYSIRVAQIPSYTTNESMMLGGYELKSCIQQILRSSPENFLLQTHDYAVYYKDLTEQPDEPFVSNGILSELLKNSKSTLIPGRVCQNVSASFLFGNKKESTLTLEIRLKLHTIERTESDKRPMESQASEQQQKHLKTESRQPSSHSHVNPVKATRTKSLPTFQPYNNHMYNIRTADKQTPSSAKYDEQSVLDRFKSAPFVDAQTLPKPKVLRRRYNTRNKTGLATRSNSMIEPIRASRTRSMVTNRQTPLMISSPIHEERSSESDDSEYNENRHGDEEEDEDEEDDEATTSPYTPQQPPYKPKRQEFHSLPDLEDLDSKKTHTIQASKIPENHGLTCVNPNCATEDSISWRYFEMDFPQNYFELQTSTEFDRKNYEGMYGPLCNACYLFLRNKGFMRPEQVVKKYLKQQKYKKVKQDDKEKKDHKFVTPSHTPSEINQVIQNARFNNQNELNDFINQLNNYGGPLTDIDPLPQDQGITPPMMATKSNTRVINVEEDKENIAPPTSPETEEFEKLIQRSFNKSSPDWMNGLFDGPTPKDNNSPKRRSPGKGIPGLPPFKTFSTRRSPRLNKTKSITTTMPSSPLMSGKHKFDSFIDDDTLNANLDLIEASLNLKNSSPHPGATRNNTTNSALSLTQPESSSPSEYFAEDTKEAQRRQQQQQQQQQQPQQQPHHQHHQLA